MHVAGLVIMAAAVGVELPAEYRHRFGPEQFDWRMLRLEPHVAVQVCKLEPAGLRVAMPVYSERLPITGVAARFRVCGDFQITASFSIRRLVPPPRGRSVGARIDIDTAETNQGASLGLFMRPGGQLLYRVGRAVPGEGGKRRFWFRWFPASARSGRLRLVRTGKMLEFMVAEGEAEQFRLLVALEYDEGELKRLRLGADPGSSVVPIEVVWGELWVRAERFARLPGLEPSRMGLWVWLAVGSAAVLALVAAVAAGWWLSRRGWQLEPGVAGLWRAVAVAGGLVGPGRAGVPRRGPGRMAGGAGTGPAAGQASWDEQGLSELEGLARGYAQANRHAVAFGQTYRFQFSLSGGKLDGPFVAWHEVGPERVRELGGSRAELRRRLPKRFQGQYVADRRDGQFICWDRQGRAVVRHYRDGELLG